MSSPSRNRRDCLFVPLIAGLSVLVPILVLILMYLPQRYNLVGAQLRSLPFFHAVLNGSTAVLLTLGYAFIKNEKSKAHRFCMLVAFVLSVTFLVSYVLSKLGAAPVPFGGRGALRIFYFFILITHIVLSASVVPLALLSLYRALNRQYEKHRKIARIAFPIWLYVAITGVLVYLFMVPYY